MFAAVQPSAKSLILDLLSTLRGGAMPVRAMVAAAALFDIAENSLRVELARLTRRGLVTRDERGLYRLAHGAAAVQARVASWTRAEERVVAWSGGWVGVHTAGLPRHQRQAAPRRQRALQFLGLRELEGGLWIRPDNLRGGVAEARRQLHELGLERTAPIFVLDQLDQHSERRARALWDVETLLAGYRDMRRTLERSERRVAAAPSSEGMVETFLLGGRAIRLLAFDPLLPEPILPAAERRALVETMSRYDRLGRQCWRRFMQEHGALSRHTPVNLRHVHPAGELPAATGSYA